MMQISFIPLVHDSSSRQKHRALGAPVLPPLRMLRMLACLLALAASVVACSPTRVTGTFDIELVTPGSRNPILGTLILSSTPLELPSMSEDDPDIDPEWFGGDAIGANSCFIAAGRPDPSKAIEAVGLVRVFDARITGNSVETPLLILSPNDVRLRILELQFFVDVVGGRFEIETEQGSIEGRLSGERVGPEDGLRCAAALDAFREVLRDGARHARAN